MDPPDAHNFQSMEPPFNPFHVMKKHQVSIEEVNALLNAIKSALPAIPELQTRVEAIRIFLELLWEYCPDFDINESLYERIVNARLKMHSRVAGSLSDSLRDLVSQLSLYVPSDAKTDMLSTAFEGGNTSSRRSRRCRTTPSKVRRSHQAGHGALRLGSGSGNRIQQMAYEIAKRGILWAVGLSKAFFSLQGGRARSAVAGQKSAAIRQATEYRALPRESSIRMQL